MAEAFCPTLTIDRLVPGSRLEDGLLDWYWLDDDDMGTGVRFSDCFNYTKYLGISCRRLMASTKGYIGLVPPCFQVGDKICVLFGCSVPVILRKVGDHHIFIGESYVHGIMDGEAIKQMNDGDLSEEEFVLR